MSYDPSTDPLNTITDWPQAVQADATALLGPWFLGWVAHQILFGVVQSQFSAYTSTDLYRKDPLRTKLFLWAVVLIDLAAVCVNCQEMYHYGTDQHRDTDSVFVVGKWDGVPNLLCAFIGALVQLFLLKRASNLFSSHLLLSYIFTGAITFLIVVSWLAGCGAFAVGMMWSFGQLEQAEPFTYNNLTGTWLWSSLAVDGTLCLSLVALLRKRFDVRSRTSPVRDLVRVSVETASYTALLGVAGAVMGVAFPQNKIQTANVPLAFTLPLPSLYALSMIVTLSSRQRRTPATVTGTVHLPDLFAQGAFGAGVVLDGGVPSPALRGGSGGPKERVRFDDGDEQNGESAEGPDEKDAFDDDGAMAFTDIRTTGTGLGVGSGRRPSAVASIVAADSAIEGETTAGHLRWA